MIYMGAGLGVMIGAFFGRYQLMRWDIWKKWNKVILVIGCFLIFFPGAFLMNLYGYHVLKISRYWILMYALLLLAILDCEKRIIPNRALLVLLGIRMILLVLDCICFPELWKEVLMSSLGGMIGGGGLFLIAGILARKGMGMGDIKMIAVVGFYLGFQLLMSDLVISLFLTVLGGIFNLAVRKKPLHSAMPFAPFVAVGTWITILLGC